MFFIDKVKKIVHHVDMDWTSTSLSWSPATITEAKGSKVGVS